MTVLGTVWPGPECVLLGHPRSPVSTPMFSGVNFTSFCPGLGDTAISHASLSSCCPADPSVSPTHQAGHQGPPQGAVSRCWHFPGQLWAPGPRTRGWTEGRRCTGIHCGGKDSVMQLQRHGVQGEERAGWLLRGQGVGRKQGRGGVSLGLPALLPPAQDPFLAPPPPSEGPLVSPSPDQCVVTPHILV